MCGAFFFKSKKKTKWTSKEISGIGTRTIILALVKLSSIFNLYYFNSQKGNINNYKLKYVQQITLRHSCQLANC